MRDEAACSLFPIPNSDLFPSLVPNPQHLPPSMPDIQAFRGIRYDLGHVGSLGDVIAPPYDVISTEFQNSLYKKHPANVVRLILNREEPGDEEQARYQRAARFLKEWQREGVLFTEADPAVYVYHQEFSFEGETHTRRGFMARVRLEPFGQGNIYPHEETMAGPKADRLRLMTACQANLSQVFGLYPDADGAAQNVLEEVIVDETPIEATDHLDVIHRLWPVIDPHVISELTGAMGGKPTFIADGHHRYETACNYRDELAKKGDLDPEHPANFRLMMCVAMSDPGMVVFPTHRLFSGLPDLTADQLVNALGDCFATRLAGEGADLAQSVWSEMETEGEQGTLGFYTEADQRWVLARITDAGRARMQQLAPDQSDAWRDLGVSILHRLVMETLLEATDLPRPGYVHLVDEVVEKLDEGGHQLAALVMPPTLDHIQTISENLERMPAKSTYFYPKLLSGLVINPIG